MSKWFLLELSPLTDFNQSLLKIHWDSSFTSTFSQCIIHTRQTSLLALSFWFVFFFLTYYHLDGRPLYITLNLFSPQTSRAPNLDTSVKVPFKEGRQKNWSATSFSTTHWVITFTVWRRPLRGYLDQLCERSEWSQRKFTFQCLLNNFPHYSLCPKDQCDRKQVCRSKSSWRTLILEYLWYLWNSPLNCLYLKFIKIIMSGPKTKLRDVQFLIC